MVSISPFGGDEMNMVQQLTALFKTHMVLRLEDVMGHLKKSRTSTMRYFREAGYHTSYNCAGEYYTLEGIPTFDGNGLWKYRDAFFSSHGTLRDTAIGLVGSSEFGYTHDELRELLGIRMYNTLLGLVNDGLIDRRDFGGEYVYVSRSNGEGQFAAREGLPPKAREIKKPAKRAPGITPAAGLKETIEVLLAYIGGHTKAESVYGHLYRKGVSITPNQIRAIFECYGLGKKNSN